MLGNFFDKKKNLSSRFDGISFLKDFYDCVSLEFFLYLEKIVENVWIIFLFCEVIEDDSVLFCVFVFLFVFSDFINVGEGKLRNIVYYDLYEKNFKFCIIEIWF